MARYTDLELLAEFRQKINFLITQKGYTQAAIAEKVGENRGNFNRYIKNEGVNPTKKTLLKYLAKLNTIFYDDLKKMEQLNRDIATLPDVFGVQEPEQPYTFRKQIEDTLESIQKSIEDLSWRQAALERTLQQFLSRLENRPNAGLPDSTPTNQAGE